MRAFTLRIVSLMLLIAAWGAALGTNAAPARAQDDGAQGERDIAADVSACAGHDCDFASGHSGILPQEERRRIDGWAV